MRGEGSRGEGLKGEGVRVVANKGGVVERRLVHCSKRVTLDQMRSSREFRDTRREIRDGADETSGDLRTQIVITSRLCLMWTVRGVRYMTPIV